MPEQAKTASIPSVKDLASSGRISSPRILIRSSSSAICGSGYRVHGDLQDTEGSRLHSWLLGSAVPGVLCLESVMPPHDFAHSDLTGCKGV